METQRQSNFELLRLVAMGFIVLHHFIFYGMNLFSGLALGESIDLEPRIYDSLLVLDSFLIIGVNLFVLISGYFSIKLSFKGLVRLFGITAFFGMLTYVYCSLHEGNFQLSSLLARLFLPLSRSRLWFVRIYFVLMLLSPFINKVIDNIGRRGLLYALIVLTFINIWIGWLNGKEQTLYNGYNVLNFIYLYCIGRFLHLYGIGTVKRGYCVATYLLCGIIIGAGCIFLRNRGINPFRLLYYNNPLLILEAVAFFLLFLRFPFYSKAINSMAAGCLSIYLMQEGGINFYDSVASAYSRWGISWTFLGLVFVFFVLSMFVPLLIEKVRQLAFGKVEKRISSWLDNKVDLTL